MSIFTIIRLFILAAIIASCSGCTGMASALIESDARTCHRDAWSVAEMTRCNAKYPQHNGTISDTIAQPISTIERAIQHRNHTHE